MRTLHLAIVFAICTATPAFAAGAMPAATGLPGTTWALDCKKPASSSNYYLAYSVSGDGRLVETLKSSGEDKDRKIRNIQVISKDWLLYTMDDADGEAVNIVTFTDKQGRKKSWWSVGNGGTAYIIDGKFPDGKGGPPWFSQCK
jgi:hypothetical protein